MEQPFLLKTDNGDIRVHQLKTWPEYFDAVKDENKKVEIRKHDRDFRVGDLLWLNRYDPTTNELGEVVIRRVTHILSVQPFVPEGYVAMSIEPAQMEIPFEHPHLLEKGASE